MLRSGVIGKKLNIHSEDKNDQPRSKIGGAHGHLGYNNVNTRAKMTNIQKNNVGPIHPFKMLGPISLQQTCVLENMSLVPSIGYKGELQQF